MENVPLYISLSFVLITAFTFFLLIRAVKPSKWVILGLLLWLVFQAYLAYSGFYLEVSTEPFRFFLAAPPAVLLIISIFISKRGRNWIQTIRIRRLILIHIVRIPVELVLYWFFMYELLPELMTFFGRNFDILAGITAPIIYYFYFIRKEISGIGLLIWNVVCLLLLLNIIVSAILATPTPFQQFAFDQPNVAILHFPLVWLPTFVVPVVLFSHFVIIYRLYVQDKGPQVLT